MKEKALIFTLVLFLMPVYTNANKVLYITCKQEREKIIFMPSASSGNYISIPKDLSDDYFNYLYKRLEQRKIDTDFIKIQQTLSETVITPLSELISKSDEIIFVITEDIINYPLDILLFENEFLFLKKPVSYSFTYNNRPDLEINNNTSGLIISNPTADPENACSIVKQLYPDSHYYIDKEFDALIFKKYEPIGFILISAHGIIYPDISDHILLNNNKIYSDSINIRHNFIYLDSCRLGISYNFIMNSKKLGAKYYLAPIISNEAGNSSTKTIEYFFKNIRSGYSFSESLFLTRTKIYNDYINKKPIEAVLWYSFPFRLYQL